MYAVSTGVARTEDDEQISRMAGGRLRRIAVAFHEVHRYGELW